MSKLVLATVLASLTLANVAAAQDVAPTKPAIIDGYRGPTVSFGARAGVSSAEGTLQVPYGNTIRVGYGYTGSGKTVGFDVGYHFSPAFTLFGLYEYGALDLQTSASFDRMAVHTITGGMRVTTNRRGRVGFIGEVGPGYHYVAISRPYPTANYVGGGLVPLRAAVGVTVIATERLRIQAMLGVAASIIERIDYMDQGCVSLDSSNCDTVDKGDREVHLHRSLTIGGTFDL